MYIGGTTLSSPVSGKTSRELYEEEMARRRDQFEELLLDARLMYSDQVQDPEILERVARAWAFGYEKGFSNGY